ncbi:S-layer homology domain-containing protein [Candidatus Peregrinibacteria bacterium]|nr:MAG: S-layer homology domain-containing protein [Candidatus Peregrinibacteria bacterium]
MKKLIRIALAAFAVVIAFNGIKGDVSANTPPAGYEDQVRTSFESNPFSDTNLNELSGLAAAELYYRAVIGGFADGEFKGDRPVNRAEAAKFLLLARYGTVADGQFSNPFWDVLTDQWYAKYVLKAASLGVINGNPDGSFRPGDSVNTAEFAKMVTNIFGLPVNLTYDYTDVSANAWYATYAGALDQYDMLPTRPDRLMSPSRKMTRNEVAIAIYQYLKNRNTAVDQSSSSSTAAPQPNTAYAQLKVMEQLVGSETAKFIVNNLGLSGGGYFVECKNLDTVYDDGYQYRYGKRMQSSIANGANDFSLQIDDLNEDDRYECFIAAKDAKGRILRKTNGFVIETQHDDHSSGSTNTPQPISQYTPLPVTTSLASTPVSQTWVEGSQDVAVIGVEVSAPASEAIELNSIRFRFYADDDGTFDAGTSFGYGDLSPNRVVGVVKIYNGLNLLDSGSLTQGAGGEYTFTATHLSRQIAAGSTAMLYAKVNLLNAINSPAFLYASVTPSSDMEIEDMNGDSHRVQIFARPLNSYTSPSPLISVIPQGHLRASLNTNAPVVNSLSPGTTNALVTQYRFQATDEAWEIDRLTLQNFLGGATNPIRSVTIKYQDESGATKTATGTLANNLVTFSGLSLYVPENGDTYLSVYVDLASNSAMGTPGQTYQVAMIMNSNDYTSANNYFSAKGQTSEQVRAYLDDLNVILNNMQATVYPVQY